MRSTLQNQDIKDILSGMFEDVEEGGSDDNPFRVLFIGAHTDDEMVCAGTLYQYAKAGAEVHVLTFSNSSVQGDKLGGKASRDILKKEYKDAMELLGVSYYTLFNYGTDILPLSSHAVRQTIYDYVRKHEFDIAFILSPHDDHQAHVCVAEESWRAIKNQIPCVYRCQFAWNTEHFRPNAFYTLDEEELEVKLGVIDCYKSQQFRYNYRDLMEASARMYGLAIKEEYAEAFELIREVR